MNASRFAIVVAIVCLPLLGACEKQASQSPGTSAEQTRRFQVKGLVRAINFADREVTIEHEEIPDYMPAMTMPFSVKDMREVQAFSAGDAIAFEFVVTKDDSWIANARKIDRNTLQLPKGASPTGSKASKERLREGDPLPAFSLVDEKGRSITADMFRGKSLVITFIFTRCPVPNFCPLMGKNFARLHADTAADPKLAHTQFLSVSFDPGHDTPEVLAKYAQSYRPVPEDRWRFATGTAEEVAKLTEGFSLQVKPQGGTIDHSLATILVGPDGVIRNIWRGNQWRVEEVVESLRKL